MGVRQWLKSLALMLSVVLLLTTCAPVAPPAREVSPESTHTSAAPASPVSPVWPGPTPTWPAAWPTAGWTSAPPESLGLDSNALLAFYRAIREESLAIHSVIVVRHGRIAAEGYYAPFGPASRQHLYSVTKSVISALIGIAIQEGTIRSVDEPVLSFFPEYKVAHRSQQKERLTIAHLLSMTSGLQWSEGAPYTTDDLGQMVRSNDWVKYLLDRPLAHEPGTVFQYNSGNSHLLSAILQKATGQTALAYAQEHLFGPLGLEEVMWQSDPQGISIGGWGLSLTPRQMAKFGYLYLNRGVWEGQALVPAAWVEQSTQVQAPFEAGADLRYGYHWWRVPAVSERTFAAIGLYGQFILVIPELDAVIVFASTVENVDIPQLVVQRLLPAFQSDEPLPPNPAAYAELQAWLAELAQP